MRSLTKAPPLPPISSFSKSPIEGLTPLARTTTSPFKAPPASGRTHRARPPLFNPPDLGIHEHVDSRSLGGFFQEGRPPFIKVPGKQPARPNHHRNLHALPGQGLGCLQTDQPSPRMIASPPGRVLFRMLSPSFSVLNGNPWQRTAGEIGDQRNRPRGNEETVKGKQASRAGTDRALFRRDFDDLFIEPRAKTVIIVDLPHPFKELPFLELPADVISKQEA